MERKEKYQKIPLLYPAILNLIFLTLTFFSVFFMSSR